MSLADLMSLHGSRITARTDHFAVATAIRAPRGASSVELAVVWGQNQAQLIAGDTGTHDVRRETVFLVRSAARAALATLVGIARDPAPDDELVVAAGAYEGTWRIVTVYPDEGDGITADCVQGRRHEAGGRARG